MAKSTEELIGEIMDGAEVEPVEVEATEAAAEETVEPVETAAEDDAAPAEETAEESQARERDEAGRFAPAAKPKPPALLKPGAKPVATPAEPAEPAQPVAPAARVPQSWTPGERELWGKLPAEAQAAVLRREQETQRALNETDRIRRAYGEAQQYQQRVDSFVKPFEGIFRAQGLEPMQGVANVVQTYAALHYAPPAQKAQILAGLISQFSTEDDVAAVLHGQAPAAQTQPQRWAPPQAPPPDPRAIVREEFQSLAQRAQDVKAQREVEAFMATNPEFIHDVAEDVQAVLDTAAKRGRPIPVAQAYEVALRLPGHEDIQAILAQRKERAAAPQRAAAAQRARAAASSVRSTPGMAAGAKKPANMYDAVEQAYAELEGQ